MASYSKIILVGHLGGEPTSSTTNNGKKVTNFSMAVSQKRNGEDSTEWYKITTWEKTAEIAEKYLKKGSKLLIEGVLSTSTYKDKEGENRFSLDVTASSLVLLDSKSDSEGRSSDAQAPSQKPNTGKDDFPADMMAQQPKDDLPF